ncbi:RagB/SusD family nutrient uptake outer membrane protein [Pontibacter anaerobius]|uniref:RagB/SusD family nutrient uptake outer membrane protein n=1 Tax=Pontibacter anaerobius TaxID=2993940 RepID=A0ABT3RA93_9BACT|nr:RagB/SusD family nutrient uptake outer membrane protein [Pontibacter anaerobius]MCX2738417.1 RagB/SusD family nutrient uptake outer membrane protein [Pontibacter anaerobius]
MKKRYLNILLAGLLTTGMLSSCDKDFLDQSPYTGINSGEALLTDNDVLTALYATYSGLQSSDLYGRTIPVIGDLLADNTFVSTYNAGRYLEFEGYFFTRNTGNISGLWSDAYTVIARTNNIVDSEQTTVTDQANVDQYKGEAYAIRALMYFELVRHFADPYTENPNAAGVPIVLKTDKDSEPARNSVAEVYAQIQADLDKAIGLMTKTSNSGRFSQAAAKALKAKVSLNMGDYEQALMLADDVISNSGVPLVSYQNLVSYWASPRPSNVETLFEVISTETDNMGTNELGYIYHQGGYGDILANPELYDSYASTDARKNLIIKGKRNRGENPAYIVNKYSNISGDRDDKKVLRISEMYLIAAEAAYRLGDEVSALTYLNTLVAERDPSMVYVSTGEQLLQDIITERRKEMAFEGERLHTLNRLQRDIVARPDGPAEIPFSSDKRILPIPQTEIDANENIEQNPGY